MYTHVCPLLVLLLAFVLMSLSPFAAPFRAGRPGQQVPQRHRRLPLHAGVEQGAHHARVPGADDGVPAAALERQPEGDAGAAVLAPGGGRPLLSPGARRRHAVADGAGLDRPRAGGRRGDLPGARERREGAGGREAGRTRTQVSQREEGHSHAGVRTGQHGQRAQLRDSAVQWRTGPLTPRENWIIPGRFVICIK